MVQKCRLHEQLLAALEVLITVRNESGVVTLRLNQKCTWKGRACHDDVSVAVMYA